MLAADEAAAAGPTFEGVTSHRGLPFEISEQGEIVTGQNPLTPPSEGTMLGTLTNCLPFSPTSCRGSVPRSRGTDARFG